MFAKPRLKRSTAQSPSKKRKFAVEEVSFDDKARAEYLTGFHKRKLQRVKNAQEAAAKRARQEKIEFRRQLREERKKAVEEHVESVHAILKRHAAAHDVDEIHSDDEEWNGFVDEAPPDIIDEEEEYIDEDKYTHVTVESVTVSRDGLERVTAEDDEAPDDEAEDTTENRPTADDKENAGRAAVRPRKPKKKKFRYESKAVRQLENMKQRTKSRRPKSK